MMFWIARDCEGVLGDCHECFKEVARSFLVCFGLQGSSEHHSEDPYVARKLLW